MKKKYIPVTFSKEELNYFTLAIVLKIIDNVKGTDCLLYYRDYHLGRELFIEEKYFIESVAKIKNALSENTINKQFKKQVAQFLDVLLTTVNSGVIFVELAEAFREKLTPYFFKVI